MNTATMNQEDQQNLVVEAVVEVEVSFQCEGESLQSLEKKIKELHRSMVRHDKHVLTVITPRLLQRKSSSISLVQTASSSDDTESSSSSSKTSSCASKDNGQRQYFAKATEEEPQRYSHFVSRELQLALAADKTRSLLQSQQMIHML